MIERADVVAARHRIAGRVRSTPVLDADVPGPAGDIPVTLKLEYLQFGGSFKIRGSLNTLLHSARGCSEIVIASGGNAGIAAATAARVQSVGCVVVVPENAPQAKVDALRDLGATVVLHGGTYEVAYARATELAAERNAFQLHAYDLPDVVAGAGTIGLELEEQVPEPNPILVAVGGGGLIGGVAAAVGMNRRVVGVEPEGSPTLHEALKHGEPVDVSVHGVAEDSLGATRLGGVAMEIVARQPVSSVLVQDSAIIAARTCLWRQFRIAVEWGGAAALAAVMSGAYVPQSGERPIIVLCGANTDPRDLYGDDR